MIPSPTHPYRHPHQHTHHHQYRHYRHYRHLNRRASGPIQPVPHTPRHTCPSPTAALIPNLNPSPGTCPDVSGLGRGRVWTRRHGRVALPMMTTPTPSRPIAWTTITITIMVTTTTMAMTIDVVWVVVGRQTGCVRTHRGGTAGRVRRAARGPTSCRRLHGCADLHRVGPAGVPRTMYY